MHLFNNRKKHIFLYLLRHKHFIFMEYIYAGFGVDHCIFCIFQSLDNKGIQQHFQSLGKGTAAHISQYRLSIAVKNGTVHGKYQLFRCGRDDDTCIIYAVCFGHGILKLFQSFSLSCHHSNYFRIGVGDNMSIPLPRINALPLIQPGIIFFGIILSRSLKLFIFRIL